MVYTVGPTSGCHINPAVRCGVRLARKMEPNDAIAYVIAQILGAIVASSLILFSPITLSGYERFQYIRDMLQKEDISIPLPTGN